MDAPPRFDPYHKWLGIVANGQPLTHYRLLRIEPFESDTEVIEYAYEKDLVDLKLQEHGKHAEFVESLTRELFKARKCLIDADKRAAYDDELRKQLHAEAEAQREAKQQTQQRATEEAVREATAGLTAELNRLRTVAEQLLTREQQALLDAQQLRCKLDEFDEEDALSTRLNAFSPFLFVDGLLARLAGEGNAIMHKAFRVAAILVSLFLVGGGLWWVISGPSRESASTPADVETTPKVPPQLEALVDQSIVTGKELSFSARVVDAGTSGGQLRYSLTNAPAGATIDGVTGQFRWTPEKDQAGRTHQITLRLADGSTPTLHDERSFGVTVENRVLVNSIGMKLAYIPAGEFLMGSPDTEEGRSSNEHQHRVQITKPFRLGVYEITQAEYERVMGKNPSHFASGKGNVAGKDAGRFPVETVSWNDAVEFCRRMSASTAQMR